jgi:hypothetical protein
MPETTMPLTVTVTIDVDTHGWARDYGITGADAIRNDVHSFLTEALRTCNENITLAEPFAMTVTPIAPAPGHDQLDALLDAAVEAGCTDIVLRPEEAPIFVTKGSGKLVPVPGFADPLDPEWLAIQIRHLVTSLQLPTNFFGNFAYSGTGADFRAFTDSSMVVFRLNPAAAAPEPLTYTMTRNVRHAGDKTWRDDTFTFSDGEVWEIVSETTLNPSGRIDVGPVTATKSGTSAAPHKFHAKLATARAADEQPEAPLTYLVDRKESREGNKHWDNALYTFSDGEIWEIITEWTQEGTGPTVRTSTEASIWVAGVPKEASHADFLTKFATSTPKNA